MVAKKKATDNSDMSQSAQDQDETRVIDLISDADETAVASAASDEAAATAADETAACSLDETAVVNPDETTVVSPDKTTLVDSDETTVVNPDDTSLISSDETSLLSDADVTTPVATDATSQVRSDLTNRIPSIDATVVAPVPQDLDVINSEGVSGDSNKKKHSGVKLFGRILLGLFILLGVTYIAGAIAFNFYAMPNTTLGGKDVSLESLSDIAAAQAKQVDAYKTTVSGFGFSTDIAASDISISFDISNYAKSLAVKQDAWLWPLHILDTHTLNANEGFTYSKAELKKLLASALEAYNKNATQPTNASIAYDEAAGSFVVTPEKAGTALDTDAVTTFVNNQIAAMPAKITLDETCLVKPSITSDDEKLKTAVENANTYLSAEIPLSLNGMDAGKITKAQISEFIVLGDDQSVSLDEAKLAEWVKTNIAAKFDTLSAKRTYTRPDGKVITVESSTNEAGSYYGWLTDEASLVSQVVEAIKNGSTSTIDVPTKQTASQVPDSNGRDWGNRYIDCDLTEQHVRMYDDSGALVWESDCVTGDTGEGHDTPTGVFFLNSNRSSGDVELRGKIDPATNEPEYISHVKYWMPFIANAVAFHDASWRSSFGGNIYTYAGSHGCVNLPSEKAEQLFGLCKIGDVVVVHW